MASIASAIVGLGHRLGLEVVGEGIEKKVDDFAAEVAAQAGYPGAARAVGNVLARRDDVPWWRVVTADGRRAAHVEHTVAITAAGPRILTESRVPEASGSSRGAAGARPEGIGR